MDQLCKEILEQLNFYKRNHTRYTKCLCRDIELAISNKPEEKVRQIFLFFLINESGLFPDLISLKVEFNNLDIAIYKNSKLGYFKPWRPPTAIIEVKREEEDLLNHEKQLLRYLDEQRSSVGILFNSSDLILFKKSDTEARFSKSHLKSVKDVPDVLREALNRVDNDLLEFEKARNGDVNSFIYLIKKYGKYALHKFTFVLKNNCNPITGCFFSYDQDCIYYDIYGKYSRKQKEKFRFKSHDFDKLISIIY